jgi:hypothetical protein
MRNPDPAFFQIAVPDPDSRFRWPKIEKTLQQKKTLYFFDQKLRYPYPKDFIKDAQAAGEAFIPQKRAQNMKFMIFFYFCGSFLPFWIRIQQLKLMRIYADPDPKLWVESHMNDYEDGSPDTYMRNCAYFKLLWGNRSSYMHMIQFKFPFLF